MRCPCCDAEMCVGKLAIERGGIERLALGYESMPLRNICWDPDDNGESVKPALSSETYLCPSCDTLVIRGAHGALTCFECSTPIAADQEACGQCGWTWK